MTIMMLKWPSVSALVASIYSQNDWGLSVQLALYGVRFDALAVHSVGESHASAHLPFPCQSVTVSQLCLSTDDVWSECDGGRVGICTELDRRRVGGVYQLNTSACNAVGY